MSVRVARLLVAPSLLVLVIAGMGAATGAATGDPPAALAVDATDCHALDGPDHLPALSPDEVAILGQDLTFAPMLGPGDLPDTSDVSCGGIRPGAWIVTGGSVCTLAFLFTNGADIYAATAGHCTSVGQRPALASGTAIGTTTFSVNGGPGNDFALIRIDAARHNIVNPEMCFWAGPVRMHTGTATGQVLLHDGHGGGVTPLPPRPRAGVGTIGSSGVFAFAGAGIPGDSGSAVETSTGGAVGVLTHIAGGAGTNVGTTLARGLALAGQSSLTLMTVDEVHIL